MVATGLTPEAIEQNPIMYEMMNEMGWRSESPNVELWVQQVRRVHVIMCSLVSIGLPRCMLVNCAC